MTSFVRNAECSGGQGGSIMTTETQKPKNGTSNICVYQTSRINHSITVIEWLNFWTTGFFKDKARHHWCLSQPMPLQSPMRTTRLIPCGTHSALTSYGPYFGEHRSNGTARPTVSRVISIPETVGLSSSRLSADLVINPIRPNCYSAEARPAPSPTKQILWI